MELIIESATNAETDSFLSIAGSDFQVIYAKLTLLPAIFCISEQIGSLNVFNYRE